MSSGLGDIPSSPSGASTPINNSSSNSGDDDNDTLLAMMMANGAALSASYYDDNSGNAMTLATDSSSVSYASQPLSPASQQIVSDLDPMNYLGQSGALIHLPNNLEVGMAVMDDDNQSMGLVLDIADVIHMATDMAMNTGPAAMWAGLSPLGQQQQAGTTAAAATTPSVWPVAPDANQTYYDPALAEQMYQQQQQLQLQLQQQIQHQVPALVLPTSSVAIVPPATSSSAAVVATVVSASPSMAIAATSSTTTAGALLDASSAATTTTTTTTAPAVVAAMPPMRRPPLQRGVASACVKCHAHKTRCDGMRPCARCTRLGRGDQCVDREKGRGRSATYDPMTQSYTATPVAATASTAALQQYVYPSINNTVEQPHHQQQQQQQMHATPATTVMLSSLSPAMPALSPGGGVAAVATVPITTIPALPVPQPVHQSSSSPPPPPPPHAAVVAAAAAAAFPYVPPSPRPAPVSSPSQSSVSSSWSSSSISVAPSPGLMSSVGHPIGWTSPSSVPNGIVVYSTIPPPRLGTPAGGAVGGSAGGNGSRHLHGGEPRRKRERTEHSNNNIGSGRDATDATHTDDPVLSRGTPVFDMIVDDDDDYDDDARSLLIWLPGMKPHLEARTYRSALSELIPWLRSRLGHMYPDTSLDVVRYVHGLHLPQCRPFCPSCPHLNTPCAHCADESAIMNPSSHDFSFSNWLMSVFFAALWCPKEVSLLPSLQLDALPMAAFAWSLLTDPTLALHEYHEHVSGLLMPSQTSPSIHRTSATSPLPPSPRAAASSPPPQPQPHHPQLQLSLPTQQPAIVNAKFLEGGRHAVSNTLTPDEIRQQQALRDAKALELMPPASLIAVDAVEHASAVAAANAAYPASHNGGAQPMSVVAQLPHPSVDNFVAFPTIGAPSSPLTGTSPSSSSSSVHSSVHSSSPSPGSHHDGKGYAGIDYSSPSMITSPLTPRMRLGLSVNSSLERLIGYSREEIRQRLEVSGWRGMLGMASVEEAKQMLRHHFRGMFGMRSDFSMIAHVTTKWGGAVRCMLWGRHDIVDGRARAASYYLAPVPIPAHSRPSQSRR